MEPREETREYELVKSISTDLLHENARLKNDLDDKERELEGLYSVIRNITYLMDWEEIQALIIDLLLDVLSPIRVCLMAIWREGENILHVRFKRTGDENVVVDRVRLPMRFNETSRWDEVVGTDEWNEYFQSLNIGDLKYSFIGLTAKERQLGFFMIGKTHHGESFRGEWRFLNAVAHYFAVTLDNAMLYQLATTDVLTGLFNRRYFDSRMERELERAERRGIAISLLMLDIDRFKQVNDRFGHPAGDQVLIELARRLRMGFQEGATLCRYGGEEFAVMLIDVELEEAKQKADAFRRGLASTPFEFLVDGQRMAKTITVSIGVACYPDDGDTPRILIDRSDQALYEAKAAGRNRVMGTGDI